MTATNERDEEQGVWECPPKYVPTRIQSRRASGEAHAGRRKSTQGARAGMRTACNIQYHVSLGIDEQEIATSPLSMMPSVCCRKR
eukprot:6206535-Pleurochrysis_carterae.AAC.1